MSTRVTRPPVGSIGLSSPEQRGTQVLPCLSPGRRPQHSRMDACQVTAGAHATATRHATKQPSSTATNTSANCSTTDAHGRPPWSTTASHYRDGQVTRVTSTTDKRCVPAVTTARQKQSRRRAGRRQQQHVATGSSGQAHGQPPSTQATGDVHTHAWLTRVLCMGGGGLPTRPARLPKWHIWSRFPHGSVGFRPHIGRIICTCRRMERSWSRRSRTRCRRT